MNPFETPLVPKKPDDKKDGGDWVVGAKKNPDGSWEYSKTARITDPKEIAELDTTVDQMDQNKAVARKERLKVPDDVKPGTAAMVSANLGNAIFLSEEDLEKDKNKDRAVSERKTKRLESLRLQRWLIVKVQHMPEYFGNNSVTDIADGVEHLIRHYEKIRGEGAKNILLAEVPYKKYAYIDDVLTAAEDLKARLFDEAVRKQ